MTDTVRRAIRTLLQVLSAAAGGLTALVAVGVLTAGQAAAAAGVMTFLSTILAAAWSGWENRSGRDFLVGKS